MTSSPLDQAIWIIHLYRQPRKRGALTWTRISNRAYYISNPPPMTEGGYFSGTLNLGWSHLSNFFPQWSGLVSLPDDVQLTKSFLTSSSAGNPKGNTSQVFLNHLHPCYRAVVCKELFSCPGGQMLFYFMSQTSSRRKSCTAATK